MTNTNEEQALLKLNSLIDKSRVHFYKPIQIAEILFHKRNDVQLNLLNVESYRNISKRWRDTVTLRLVGRRCTSSQKFQDNIFDSNAIPPETLQVLSEINETTNGGVETYIYHAISVKLGGLYRVADYLANSNPTSFDYEEVLTNFNEAPGLKRSVDKIYEISIYALFSAIVRALGAEITIRLANDNKELLSDFKDFIEKVLKLNSSQPEITIPANLYRLGVTNAADRGLDMWSNFGPVIQVKHLTLNPELVEEIAGGIVADKIIIVCLDAEQEAISSLLQQVGWGYRIQGIITLSNLIEWYKLCMAPRYQKSLGEALLNDFRQEFEIEFPSYSELRPFIESRNYNESLIPENWIRS